MNVSKRTKNMQSSPIRKLMPYANKAKDKGIKIYHLNIGQPDIETPKQILDAYKNFDQKVVAYGPSQGLPEYRKALKKYYEKHDIDLDVDNIIVTTAGSEAITFALIATCNPGDEVIVPEPFYTNYNGFASVAGVKIVPLTTHAEKGFRLPSKQKMTKLISPKTKAIMMCSPGNPTGVVYTLEEIQNIVDLAKEHGLFVISDEVYREFVYDGQKHTSILHMQYFEDHAIMVDSISKRFSACGARIGALVSRNKDIMNSVLKLAQARLCPPTIDQYAAAASLSIPDSYMNEVKMEYKNRRDIVFSELQKIEGIICKKPKGAFYIIAKLPIKDSEHFAEWLLSDFCVDNKTVMFAPAQGFYATPNTGMNEIRIAYVLNEQDLRDAMHILREGLKEYKRYYE